MKKNIKKILKKDSKGITLVALVITIIILLILVGISISALTGSGLFQKANDTVNRYGNAQNRENSILGEYENYINNLGNIKSDLPVNLEPSINGKIGIDKNQVEVSITLNNKEETTIIYSIKDAKTDNELEKVKKVNELTHTFLGLEEGKEYEVIVQATNKYGEDTKNKNVTTLLSQVPILTENNNNIVQEGFLNEYADEWGVRMHYYAFDGDDSTLDASIKLSDSSIGSNIGYDFGRPIKINRVTGKIRMLSYKIQYSDDSVQWNDALNMNSAGSNEGDNFSNDIESSIGAHRFWRLYVNGGQLGSEWSALVYSLQFYGEQDKVTIEI